MTDSRRAGDEPPTALEGRPPSRPYTSLAEYREALPELPMPTTKLRRGKYVRCGRCKCKGSALYNHRNGDTHCYLCNGRGWVVRLTAAEKAAEAAEGEWLSHRYYNGYHLKIKAGHLARKAAQEAQGFVYHRHDNPVEPDPEMTERWQARTRKLAAFWLTTDLDAQQEGAR